MNGTQPISVLVIAIGLQALGLMLVGAVAYWRERRAATHSEGEIKEPLARNEQAAETRAATIHAVAAHAAASKLSDFTDLVADWHDRVVAGRDPAARASENPYALLRPIASKVHSRAIALIKSDLPQVDLPIRAHGRPRISIAPFIDLADDYAGKRGEVLSLLSAGGIWWLKEKPDEGIQSVVATRPAVERVA